LQPSDGPTVWPSFSVIVRRNVVEADNRIFEVSRIVDRIPQKPEQIPGGNVVVVVNEGVETSLRKQ
jgi:hypothetical protein